MPTVPADRRAGAVLGLAYGDAWGAPVEFLSYAEIRHRHPDGVAFPDEALITDDTQLSIAVWHALDAAVLPLPGGGSSTAGRRLRNALVAFFLDWRVDPENWRAPGVTCMSALGAIDRGVTWWNASVLASKGCGTVMRAPWIGLHPSLSDAQVGPVAQLQSVLTHGHPAATVAADVTARLVRDLATGAVDLRGAADRALDLVDTLDPCADLAPLVARTIYDSPRDYLAAGAGEVGKAIEWVPVAARVLAARGGDPCQMAGEGWIAEETLAVALTCVTAFPDDPLRALGAAVESNGDSDSIAAVTGALVGAAHGHCWPTDWAARLEPRYHTELTAIAGGDHA